MIGPFSELDLAGLNASNRALVELIALANDNGWVVSRVNWTHPIRVTLVDVASGATVMVGDDYGLVIPAIVRGLHVPERRKLVIE